MGKINVQPVSDRTVEVSAIPIIIEPSDPTVREIRIVNKTANAVYVGGPLVGDVLGDDIAGEKLDLNQGINFPVGYSTTANPEFYVACAAGETSVLYVLEMR